MTTQTKHVFFYGSGVIVIGIVAAYLYNKKQASASPDTQQLGTAGAIPNTQDFGADFTGSSIADFGFGEPVQDYGPGSNLVIPPPYVEPPPRRYNPKRKRCGCCPDVTMLPPDEIAGNNLGYFNTLSGHSAYNLPA